MRPQGSFPAGPGEPGVEARGTGPRAGPGCGDHRPPPRALRPRLAARPTSRLGGWSLFAAPQRRQMRPRRARRPCGSAAAVAPGASLLPPPSRALTQHATAAAASHPPSEEGGGTRRGQGGGGRAQRAPGAGGLRHSATRRSGTRVGPPQRAAASGTAATGAELGEPRLHPEDARLERLELPRRRAVGVAPRGPGRGWDKGALPASGSACPVPGDRLLAMARVREGAALAGRLYSGVHTPCGDSRREKWNPLSYGVQAADHPVDPRGLLLHPALSPTSVAARDTNPSKFEELLIPKFQTIKEKKKTRKSGVL